MIIKNVIKEKKITKNDITSPSGLSSMEMEIFLYNVYVCSYRIGKVMSLAYTKKKKFNPLIRIQLDTHRHKYT